MAGRRLSARRLSMSRAARRYLKEKKLHQKRRHGNPGEPSRLDRAGLWILALAALLVIGLVAAWITTGSGSW